MIFIVEDDLDIREMESYALTNSGFEVAACETGAELFERIEEETPQLILLDIMLPGEDGLEILGRLRSDPATSEVPIMMVTAKTSEIDKVRGLDQGADDYLTKPFSVEELLARLRVTIRRLALIGGGSGAVYTNGALRIDYSAGCASLNGEELKLTPMEYRLLCLLAKNTGKVLTHTYITQNIWGRSWENDVGSLRVFMAALRKKLESAPDSPAYIQTHIGIGYRMMKVD